MTLTKGQYQIGDIVFGAGTNIIVTNFQAQSYDVNAQDYQISRSDETRFGLDTFKPTTISMNLEVIYNWLLDPFKNTIPNFWADKPTVSDLATEWRANDIRNSWGAIKPLFFCGRDNINKMVFGRPGQFSAEKVSHNSTVVKCVAEFRRADTLVYAVDESAKALTGSTNVIRSVGDSDSWCRIIIPGPATNPAIQIGNNTIQVNTTVASGKLLEINSYPWSRRIVNSDGLNLRNSLSSSSIYLDKLKLPMGTSTARIVSGATSATLYWRDAWSAID